MLFVEPTHQERGLGRRLLARVLDGAGEAIHATCTDSAQPISNALYSRYGMCPGCRCSSWWVGSSTPCPGCRGRFGRCRSRSSAPGRPTVRAPGGWPRRSSAWIARPSATPIRGTTPTWRSRVASATCTRRATGRRSAMGTPRRSAGWDRSRSRTPRSWGPSWATCWDRFDPAGAFSAWVPGSASAAVSDAARGGPPPGGLPGARLLGPPVRRLRALRADHPGGPVAAGARCGG